MSEKKEKYDPEHPETIVDAVEGFKRDTPTSVVNKVMEELEKLKGDSQSLGITVIYTKATLHLDENGELWREPREKYSYFLAKNSDRHKLLLLLTSSNVFHPTKTISTLLGEKSEATISSEKRKINALAKKKLGLETALIEDRKGSGYRINPDYEIIIKTT